MKKHFYFIPITFIFCFLFINANAQTVGYNYDSSGNITSRKVIVLKSSSPAPDSIAALHDTEVNIRIYPNPTRGLLRIEIPDYKENEILSFQVYDMNGRLLLSTKTNNADNTLDISRFSNATYILQLTRDNKNSSWKIIKTN